jgi:hypothetical protein
MGISISADSDLQQFYPFIAASARCRPRSKTKAPAAKRAPDFLA